MNSTSRLEFDELLRARAKELSRQGACALEPMYDLVASRLLRYASSLTRTEEEAEDILQSSLLRLAKHPKKLSAAKRPWSYLLKIVRNESYDLLYRKKPLAYLPTIPAEINSVEISFDSWERCESVRWAIQKLSAVQAEVITLKIWEGMSFREIADLTESPLHTIASRYRYAMEKLAVLLKMYSEKSEISTRPVHRNSVSVSVGFTKKENG